MPKFLKLNGPETYRLSADTDLDELPARIGKSMEESDSVEVEVEMGDDPRVTGVLVLNGRAVDAVLLTETPEPTIQ